MMLKEISIVLITLLLSSCISYHHDGTDAYNESVHLERGVTTADWVYDHLGQPRSRHTRSDGSEILHYRFDEEEETRIHLLFVINFHSKDRNSTDLD